MVKKARNPNNKQKITELEKSELIEGIKKKLMKDLEKESEKRIKEINNGKSSNQAEDKKEEIEEEGILPFESSSAPIEITAPSLVSSNPSQTSQSQRLENIAEIAAPGIGTTQTTNQNETTPNSVYQTNLSGDYNGRNMYNSSAEMYEAGNENRSLLSSQNMAGEDIKIPTVARRNRTVWDASMENQNTGNWEPHMIGSPQQNPEDTPISRNYEPKHFEEREPPKKRRMEG